MKIDPRIIKWINDNPYATFEEVIQEMLLLNLSDKADNYRWIGDYED